VTPRSDAVGIVLAGGRSSRLTVGGLAHLPPGGKGLLELGGSTFLERIVTTLAAELGRVIVVAAPGQPLPALPAGVEIVHDTIPGAGPLAGIRDGLEAATHHVPCPRGAFLCSCDVPLLRREVVRLLVDRLLATGAAWAVPLVDGHPQVLVSAVSVHMRPRIEAQLAAGRRDLRGLVSRLHSESPAAVEQVSMAELACVDPALESFMDIDTPADLARLVARGISPSAG
jgi:molybdopterin-guanine dinucleotide biosynthesis protein A